MAARRPLQYGKWTVHVMHNGRRFCIVDRSRARVLHRCRWAIWGSGSQGRLVGVLGTCHTLTMMDSQGQRGGHLRCIPVIMPAICMIEKYLTASH
jgi:hypothetical protein